MATETQSAEPAPELTILHRVASIPLVNDSLSAVHTSLSSNPYLSSPYTTAQAISNSAIRYSEPLAARLAPILVRADGFANKGLDAVESRYPYPFKTPTDDILNDLKTRQENAKGAASKAYDERVLTPAYNVAEGIDQRFTPLVDYFAVAVSKLHGSTNGSAPTEPDAKYQYQRAYALSLDLKDQLFYYSNEQLKQLQSQSVLVQRATQTAHDVSDLASSSIVAAQTKAHALSDVMLQELQRIQTSTAALPAHLQASFKPVQEGLSSTISDLSAVIKSELPPQEKLSKIGDTVKEHVNPLLEAATLRVQEAIKAITAKKEEAKENVTNGNGVNH
ncbi:hypothetical protein BV25DRAFT_1882239 [Artomyces pyxidatus]|uniref:Uncharacterized protein n=1 Tax=Artomyces pyxidatus TaxID=48021 RepID=A0ACB8T8I7_9AGAM|nr:hypothetical protein BV25DRAFT_1882239 [Artomyces pyxidatus]